MAEHRVDIDLPPVEASHEDLVVRVFADEETLGHLTISRGGVGWYSAGDKQERHFTWEQFDRFVKREFGE